MNTALLDTMRHAAKAWCIFAYYHSAAMDSGAISSGTFKTLTAYCKGGKGNTVTIEGGIGRKEGFIDSLHGSFPHLKIIPVLSDDELIFIWKALESSVGYGINTVIVFKIYPAAPRQYDMLNIP